MSKVEWLANNGLEIGSRTLKHYAPGDPYEFMVTTEVLEAFLETFGEHGTEVDKDYFSNPLVLVTADEGEVIEIRAFSSIKFLKVIQESLNLLLRFPKCALREKRTKSKVINHMLKIQGFRQEEVL